MKRKPLLILFLISAFSFFFSAEEAGGFLWAATETKTDSKPSLSEKKEFRPVRTKKRSRRKSKTDFWTKTQKLKRHLSKEDLEGGDPKIQFPNPSLRPESSPCGVGPNMNTPAGVQAECQFK